MSSSVCWRCGQSHGPEEPCEPDLDPRVGTVLDGKYQIVRVLGAGGMGKVYEGLHVGIGRRVAIKFMLPGYATHRDLVARFENEARAAGRLNHENIAAVYDLGAATDGARFLVMELLDGEDCERLLTRESALPVARAVDIVCQVCRGLAAAHAADIVHRDLKPANLFLARRADGTDWVKILDFGIAKLRGTGDQPTTKSGTPMGTAHYMSPEQARGEKTIDHRTDVYALGVILYELLSGKQPYTGSSYMEIVFNILSEQPAELDSLRPGLPKELVAVVKRAMSREPASRHATVKELEDALAPFAGASIRPAHGALEQTGGERTLSSEPRQPTRAGSSTTTSPVTPRTFAGKLVGRARGVRSALGLGALVLLAGGLGAWLRFERAAPPSVATRTIGAARSPVSPAAKSEPAIDVRPSAGSRPVSGQLERPDGGVDDAGATARAGRSVAVPTGKKPEPAGATRKTAAAPAGASAVPGTAPVRPSLPGTLDIDREPNF